MEGREFVKVPTKTEQELERTNVDFMSYVRQFDGSYESESPALDTERCCAMVIDRITFNARQCNNRGETRVLNLDGGDTTSNAFCKQHDKIYSASVRSYKDACSNIITSDPVTGRMVITVQYLPKDTEKQLVQKLRKLRSCYKLRRAHQLAFFFAPRCRMDANHLYPMEILMIRIQEIDTRIREVTRTASPRRETVSQEVLNFGTWVSNLTQSLSPNKKQEEKPKAVPTSKKTQKKKKGKKKDDQETEDMIYQAISLNKPFANMIEKIKGTRIVHDIIRQQFTLQLQCISELQEAMSDRGDPDAEVMALITDWVEDDLHLDVALRKKKGGLVGNTEQEKKKDFFNYLDSQYDPKYITASLIEDMESIIHDGEMQELKDNDRKMTKDEVTAIYKEIDERVVNEREKNIRFLVNMFYNLGDFYLPGEKMFSLIRDADNIRLLLHRSFDQIIYFIMPYVVFQDIYRLEPLDKLISDFIDARDWTKRNMIMDQIEAQIKPQLISMGMMFDEVNMGKFMMDDGTTIDLGDKFKHIDMMMELGGFGNLAIDLIFVFQAFAKQLDATLAVMRENALFATLGRKMIFFGSPTFMKLIDEYYRGSFEQNIADMEYYKKETDKILFPRLNRICRDFLHFTLANLFQYMSMDYETNNPRDIILKEFATKSAAMLNIPVGLWVGMIMQDETIMNVYHVPYSKMSDIHIYMLMMPLFYHTAGYLMFQANINELMEPMLNERFKEAVAHHKDMVDKLNRGKMEIRRLEFMNIYNYRLQISIFNISIVYNRLTLPLIRLTRTMEENIQKIIPIINMAYKKGRIVVDDSPMMGMEN
jgi:hypothetical protein